MDAPVPEGLSAEEVLQRRARHGWNEIAAPHPSRLLAVAKRFWGPSAWMIEAIMALSLVLHRATDAAIAGVLLVINAAIGTLHERRAEQAVEMLKRRLGVTARVRRDGAWTALPARELVPGDLMRVRMGDIAAADLRLASGELEVDQSALTGEAQLVARGPGDLVYAGSLMGKGEATGIVEGIGAATYYGRTVELVRVAAPKLHLDEIVARLVRWLLLVVILLLAAFAAAGLAGRVSLDELLPLALVMLMGAVPVALPAMFTVSTAYAARRLADKGVLVTRLSATEDAASMTHLFLDKTGTITLNRLSIAGVKAFAATEDEVLRYALAASEEANRDPIDEAVAREAARRFGGNPPELRRTRFVPFSPQTRRTEARINEGGRAGGVVKGAVEAVIAWCSAAGDADALRNFAETAGASGARTIAVGIEREGVRRIAGAVILADPPRPDSQAMIAALRGLGVATKMLTGDALPVARAVARRVGLGAVGNLPADEAELARRIGELDGFAQVYPQDKHRVIAACQKRGLIVGMTGDGVNDAPALRQAEVGIAVSSATDVAKAAASVVLTREGLSGIVDIVRNGREVYERVLTWMINKVSRTVLKTSFVLAGYLLTGHLPISASAMLLVVVGTDFAKIALATDRVRPSEHPDEWHVTGFALIGAAIGVLLTAEAVAIFCGIAALYALPLDGPQIHGLSFDLLLSLGLFSVLSMRERRSWRASIPSRALGLSLVGALLVGLALAAFGAPGLPAIGVLPALSTAAASGVAALLINDPVKRLLYRHA